MSTRRAFPDHNTGSSPVDDGVEAVAAWFEQQQMGRHRFRWALRDSLDELMDGQRTGRWCYQHLSKTEKTYLGTAVEINLTKEFVIPPGDDLDWEVAGADVDCKFSKDLGGWEIPMEMYRCADHEDRAGVADHPALLVWIDDDHSRWAAGVLRITDETLRWRTGRNSTGAPVRAYNRDNKRRIGEHALGGIRWLWGGMQNDLPSNLLLHLDPDARQRIFSAGDDRALGSGQKRINQLFREVTGRICSRQTILTVGQQDDAPKRARDARRHLMPEGYFVLGHQTSDPLIARWLRLTVPAKGEWISVRVAAVGADDDRPKVFLQGRWWAVAAPGDTLGAAPTLGKQDWYDLREQTFG